MRSSSSTRLSASPLTQARRVLRVAIVGFVLALTAAACGGSADEPVAVAAATEVPATEVPATEVPATEVPATEVPATEVPATEVPATEVPAEEPAEAPAEEAAEETADVAAEALDPAVAEIGMTVWGASCAGCHGENGEGSNKGRPLVGIAIEQPDAAAHIEIVTVGKGRMPAFAENLTAEEIDAVVAYMRSTF